MKWTVQRRKDGAGREGREDCQQLEYIKGGSEERGVSAVQDLGGAAEM